ncbi:MAG: sialate O-acetylesterase [Dysgonomonas sp.]
MKNSTLFAAIILCIFSFQRVKADVILPSVISDNMVLQQDSEVNLWGKASPNEKIKIVPSWNKKEYTIQAGQNGKWTVKIKTPKATTNQTIAIEGDNKITLKNILIGEVWLCSGQSNMDFQIAKGKGWRTGVLNEEATMKDADYPEIRLFHVTQALSPDKELDDCDGYWEICTPENIKTFSAIAFFFGRELYNNLHVPVGLIQSTWGGTPAEAWTKMSVMENDPVYAQLVADHENTKNNYPADLKKYEEEKARYDALINKGEEAGKAPKKPKGINHNKALSILWNAMIHPLVPYTMKGVIWYQGESNSNRADDYTHVFTNMINSWRTEWEQGDFPFYFVQIAPHYKQPPQIREAQMKTWQTAKNTGMAVITDVGDSTDIHPRNKLVPAQRLSYWALAKTYGKDITYSGPLYKSMQIKGDKVILSFDYTDKGLTSKGGKLKGFAIAGNDKIFYPAETEINGNTVTVSSPNVNDPVAVRYGWDKFFRANLFNGADLPATPFRTDNWDN